MNIQAEVSYYPLARTDIFDCINKFCAIISSKGLNVVTNAMSSVVNGDTANVMHALSEAIETVGQDSKFVLICKISNSCPVEHKGNNRKL